MVYEQIRFLIKNLGCIFLNCSFFNKTNSSKNSRVFSNSLQVQVDSIQAKITINNLLKSGWIDLNTVNSDCSVLHKRMTDKLPNKTTSFKKFFVKKNHLSIKEGETRYKKTSSQTIMAAMQLGIGYSVGRLSAKPERDVLIQDFSTVEHVWFPAIGTKETPSHKFNDFNIKTYAPIAFRYFREIFGIKPSDYMLSLSVEQLSELSNPGASGSLFFISKDDIYIIKTVQYQEADFLQRLLPGYYMNLHQNPMTFLPKFLGLYCYQTSRSNIRLVVMNNILPSSLEYIQKYDLKGSTFKRFASDKERCKRSPVYKDVDFIEHYKNGIQLDSEVYDSVIKTLERDVRVLQSFKIMDYSILIGVVKYSHSAFQVVDEIEQNTQRSNSFDKQNFSRLMRSIIIGKKSKKSNVYGGIPAFNDEEDELLIFMGLIDILQSYRTVKKIEHQWKSILHDGNTISVHNPQFYANRFLEFCKTKIFKRRINPNTLKLRKPVTSISDKNILNLESNIIITNNLVKADSFGDKPSTSSNDHSTIKDTDLNQ